MATHSSIPAWKNPIDRGTWQATVPGVTKESDMTQQLNTTSTIKICWGEQAGREERIIETSALADQLPWLYMYHHGFSNSLQSIEKYTSLNEASKMLCTCTSSAHYLPSEQQFKLKYEMGKLSPGKFISAQFKLKFFIHFQSSSKLCISITRFKDFNVLN